MQRPSRWPDGRAPTPGASSIFSLTAPSTTKTSTLSLHDALPICCQGSCRYGATGVEPEPSEPEHRSAQDGHREIVRGHVFLTIPPSLSDDECADERRHPRADVHHCAASKIQRAEISHPPADSPDPM